MTTIEELPHDPVDELGILLARYADTVLKPDPFAMDRVRSELRARAQRASVHRRAEALAVAAVPEPVVAARRGLFSGWSLRRASFATAASLVLGVSVATTTFAASRAGGPLYESRVWVETATLPREPGPRLQAEIAFAQTRLAEASAAAVQGDAPAVAAALEAFNGIVAMTVDEQADQGGAHDVALRALQQHLATLRAIVGTAPGASQAALAKALAKSDVAVHKLEATPDKPTDAGQGGSNGEGGSSGQGSNQGGSGQNPGQGGSNGGGVPGVPGNDPDATPKPGKTTPPADPAPTPSHGNGGGNGSGGGNGGDPGGGTPGGSGGGGSGGGGNGGGAHSPPPDAQPAKSHLPKDPSPGKQHTPKP